MVWALKLVVIIPSLNRTRPLTLNLVVALLTQVPTEGLLVSDTLLCYGPNGKLNAHRLELEWTFGQWNRL